MNESQDRINRLMSYVRTYGGAVVREINGRRITVYGEYNNPRHARACKRQAQDWKRLQSHLSMIAFRRAVEDLKKPHPGEL